MGRQRYDTADETLYRPVSPSEVDAYLGAGGRPLLNRNAIKHFLYRCRVTISTLEGDNKQLRRDFEKATENKRRVGTPTTLSPMDAIRFASPEDISAIVGHLNSSQLNALAAYVADARTLREDLAADLNRIRAAATTLAERADLPTPVRVEFARLLNTLPADPAPVPIPKVLEFAEVDGLVPSTAPRATTTSADVPTTAPAATSTLDPADPPVSPAGGVPLELPAAGAPDPLDLLTHTRVADLPQYGAPPPWRDGPGLVRQGTDR